MTCDPKGGRLCGLGFLQKWNLLRFCKTARFSHVFVTISEHLVCVESWPGLGLGLGLRLRLRLRLQPVICDPCCVFHLEVVHVPPARW